MGAAVPTQSRSGTETPREAASAARLALAELLLFSEEPVECARATVDWLAERIGARKAVCALISRWRTPSIPSYSRSRAARR